MNVRLEFGNVPPSVNRRRGEHWSKTRKRKQEWQDWFFIALMEQKLPKLARVHATAEITLPKNRRRDEGNYRDVLEKALGDALQLQWLPDDTPEFFTFGEVTFNPESGKAKLVVTLDCEVR